MMLLHEKIHSLRLGKYWSQETIVDKLEISLNDYGCVDRGEANVQLSRILQIAKLFDIGSAELFQSGEGKNVFNSMGNGNTQIQNNSSFSTTDELSSNMSCQTECRHECLQMELKIEKQSAVIKQANIEILLLKKINELLEEQKIQ